MAGDVERLTADQFQPVLAAARTGAAWALERLYHSLAGAVVGYLRLQGAEDPEDLSNEVFLGVFRGLGGFEGDEPALRSWVFSIAHRRVIDDRRRRSRRAPACAHDVAGFDLAGSADTEGEAIVAIEAERVAQLCQSLAPDQRDVLLLRLIGDLSLEQTASAMGKPVGSVKALQHRALANLKKQLSQEISHRGVSR